MTVEHNQQEPFIMARSAQEERIAQVISPVITGEGYELVQLKLVQHGPNVVLSVFVDMQGEPKGISLDQLQSLSYLVGDVLDVADNNERLFSGAYDLELSSPGLDRPLTKVSHFVAAAGQLIKLKTDGRAGLPKNLTANLLTADETGAYVQWPAGAAEPLCVPYSAMQQANTVFVFEPKAAPKASKKRI